MVKYTRDDVIVTKEQAEKAGLQVGDLVYFHDRVHGCIEMAYSLPDAARPLLEINFEYKFPFSNGVTWYDCVMIKKVKEKHIVPFDFSLEEDRNALMGKRIKSIATDMIVTDFACRCGYGWQVRIAPELGFDGEFLFTQFVFADGENAGKPVGKEVFE